MSCKEGTHHFACDCREEMVKRILVGIISEHNRKLEERYVSGTCRCPLCTEARKVLGMKER